MWQEPTMVHGDTGINAYRKRRDTPFGLSVIHGAPPPLGDPYDVAHGICLACCMEWDGGIWLSIRHGDTQTLAGMWKMVYIMYSAHHMEWDSLTGAFHGLHDTVLCAHRKEQD